MQERGNQDAGIRTYSHATENQGYKFISGRLSYIQQMLGHENISITSGLYAFVILDTVAKAIERTNPDNVGLEKNWKREEIVKVLYRL